MIENVLMSSVGQVTISRYFQEELGLKTGLKVAFVEGDDNSFCQRFFLALKEA